MTDALTRTAPKRLSTLDKWLPLWIGLAMVAAFSSDLYRVPFVMGREVFATASLVVLAAALVSAFAIRGRINNLDMIEVLKTRE